MASERRLDFSTFSRNVRLLCAMAVFCFALSARVAFANAVFVVGSFSKCTTAAPCSQTVTHSLGWTPRGVIFWSTGRTSANAFGNSYNWFIGTYDGTAGFAAAGTSTDNLTNAAAARQMGSNPLLLIDDTGNTIARASITAWSSTTISLNWTTNNSTAYIIHYAIIGDNGSGATVYVKNQNWQMPASATPPTITTSVSWTAGGNWNIANTLPDAVFTYHIGQDIENLDTGVDNAAQLAIGAMDAGGEQWANLFGLGSYSTPATSRTQRTDNTIVDIAGAGLYTGTANFVSMDGTVTTSGFTVDFTQTYGQGTAGQAVSLAFKGINAQVGSFNKCTGMGSCAATTTCTGTSTDSLQSITTGFQPGLVILTSVQDVTSTGANTESRFAFGAADLVNEHSSASTDRDGTSPSRVRSIDQISNAVYMKVNNDTSTIDAQAHLESLDATGFTLDWCNKATSSVSNDAVATEILYLALGSLNPSAVKMQTMSAQHNAKGVRIEWTTQSETETLGFHVYRDTQHGRTRLTTAVIPGQMLRHNRISLKESGHTYSIWDTSRSAIDNHSARFWIEELDINGKRSWFGPLTAVEAKISDFSEKTVPTSPTTRNANAQRPQWQKGSGEAQSKFDVSGQRLRAHLRSFPRSSKLTALGMGNVRSSPNASLQSIQSAIASEPSIKLTVQGPGMHKVSPAKLASAGLSGDVDPRSIALFYRGQQVPIAVWGETDGRLDPSDAIVFFSSFQDTPYSGEAVYWLRANETNPKRIQPSAVSSAASLPLPTAFTDCVSYDDRTIYVAALHNGDADNFLGPPIFRNSDFETTFALNDYAHDTSTTPLIEISLQGLSLTDHMVSVEINNVPIGNIRFENQARSVKEFAVNQMGQSEILKVRLTAAGSQDVDVSAVDSIRVCYPRRYVAKDGVLWASVLGPSQMRIEGLHPASARIFDVTEPADVFELSPNVDSTTAPNTLGFQVSASQARQFIAISDDKISTAVVASAHRPSNLIAHPGADFIILGPREFLEAARPLSDARQAEGLVVARVDIEDVYDEFSFGEKDPEAIKRFFSYAQHHWTVKPHYVLLLGDASFDSRNFLGLGASDVVPTHNVDTTYFETASDDWFVDHDNNTIAEVAIGRWPARTPQEVDALVRKTLAIGRLNPQDKLRSLFISDKRDGFDFERQSGAVAAALAAGLDTAQLGRVSSESSGGALNNALQADPALVHYFGHGAAGLWAGNVLTNAAAADLPKSDSVPIYFNMTCLNGMFHDAYSNTLAEALLSADRGGAAGVWASSGLTEPGPQIVMSQAALRYLVVEKLPLGEAVRRSKYAIRDRDVRRTWVLLADPTLRLFNSPWPHAYPMNAKESADIHDPESAPMAQPRQPSDGCSVARTKSRLGWLDLIALVWFFAARGSIRKRRSRASGKLT